MIYNLLPFDCLLREFFFEAYRNFLFVRQKTVEGENMKKTKIGERQSFFDSEKNVRIAAAAIIFTITAFFIWSAVRSGTNGDEDYYLTLPQRFLKHDRMIVDEWHMSQFFSVFLLLPYRIYTWCVGGNAGVVLFMRCLYIAVNFILYWYLCIKLYPFLREWAVSAAALFCADHSLGAMSFSYYSMGLQAIVIVCMILFFEEKELPRRKAVFAGFVFACAVLNQPIVALLYFAWSIVVLLKVVRPREASSRFYEISKRTWLFATFGIAVCAVGFLSYLLITVGPCDLIENLPYLFRDENHNIFSLSYLFDTFKTKAERVVYGYGAINCCVMISFIAAVPLIRRISRILPSEKDRLIKKGVVVASVLCGVICILSMAVRLVLLRSGTVGSADSAELYLRKTDAYYSSVLIMLTPSVGVFLGLISFLLCDCRNPDTWRFSAVFYVCVVISALVDITSNVTVFYAGKIMYIPTLFFLKEILCEPQISGIPSGSSVGSFTDASSLTPRHFSNNSKKQRIVVKTILSAAAVAWVLIIILQTSFFVFLPYGAKKKKTVEDGPYKGCILQEDTVQFNEALRSDVESIRKECEGSLYVGTLFPYIYLYADLKTATFSTYYSDGTERISDYWRLNPAHRPQYVYMPWIDPIFGLRNDDNLNQIIYELVELSKHFEYTVHKGKAGYIIKVDKWLYPD